MRARAAGRRTIGYDTDPGCAARARESGALDDVAADAEEALAADFSVLAVPLEATCAHLRALRERPARPGRLLIDVASLKAPVLVAAAGLAGFVATHPIAGSERSGPEAGRADLFAGRIWAYVPPDDPALEARLLAFIAEMGARPFAVDAGDHDRIVGTTSHLPQIVAVALAQAVGERLDEEAVATLGGAGLASMTRLGASSWTMWRSILRENAPVVAQEVRRVAGILTQIADELAAGDSDRLGSRFAAAAAARARLRADPSGGDAPPVACPPS